jgi:hypothetical protein
MKRRNVKPISNSGQLDAQHPWTAAACCRFLTAQPAARFTAAKPPKVFP